MKLLHGEHKLTILRPLQPDMKIKCRAVIQDVLDKRVRQINTLGCTRTVVQHPGGRGFRGVQMKAVLICSFVFAVGGFGGGTRGSLLRRRCGVH